MTKSRSIVTSVLYLQTRPLVCLQSSRLSRLAAGIVLIFVSCGWLSGCCGVRMTGGCGGPSVAMMQSNFGCDSGCASGCSSGIGGSSSCGGCTTLFNGQIASRMRNGLFGGCTSGCGEVYYDEQINEPPTCDPCGANGQFVGGGRGPCRPLLERIRDMMGTPFMSGCNSCGGSSGCDSCSTGGCSSQYSANTGGYCSQCNDGTAGNPQNYSHQPSHTHSSAMQNSGINMQGMRSQSNALPSPARRPTPTPRSDNSLLMEPAPSNLQPIPDAAADAMPPVGFAPVPSGSRGSRTPMKVSSNSGQGKTIPASSRRVQPKLVTR